MKHEKNLEILSDVKQARGMTDAINLAEVTHSYTVQPIQHQILYKIDTMELLSKFQIQQLRIARPEVTRIMTFIESGLLHTAFWIWKVDASTITPEDQKPPVKHLVLVETFKQVFDQAWLELKKDGSKIYQYRDHHDSGDYTQVLDDAYYGTLQPDQNQPTSNLVVPDLSNFVLGSKTKSFWPSSNDISADAGRKQAVLKIDNFLNRLREQQEKRRKNIKIVITATIVFFILAVTIILLCVLLPPSLAKKTTSWMHLTPSTRPANATYSIIMPDFKGTNGSKYDPVTGQHEVLGNFGFDGHSYKDAQPAVTVCNGKYYLSVGNDVFQYDPFTQDGLMHENVLSTKRSYHMMACLDKGDDAKLMVCGGWDDVHHKALDSCETCAISGPEVSPCSNTTLVRMLHPVYNATMISAPDYNHVLLLTTDNSFETVLWFDRAKDEWMPWIQGDFDFDNRKFEHSVFLNGKLVLSCGSCNHTTNCCQVLNTASELWSKTANMKYHAAGYALVSLMGKTYALGGVDADGRPVDEVEYYDINDHNWKTDSMRLSDNRNDIFMTAASFKP